MIMKGPLRPALDRQCREFSQFAEAQGVHALLLPCRYMLLTYLEIARRYPQWTQRDCVRLTAYAHDAPIAAVEAAVFPNG